MTIEKDDTSGADIFVEEDLGYRKALGPRQIQMIAIGGAIGTGLFMGAGGRLQQAGPALVLVYALCGFFAFLILRALGELVMHRPTSGSFVSYSREFFGEKMAFAAGWLYWMNWAMTAVVDVTAVALYMNFFKKYWAPLGNVDQWVFALAAVVLVLGLNLVSVKVFGELEFWFALIKVVALAAFLGFGIYFVLFGTPIEGHSSGFSMITDNGGLFPNGILPAVVVIQGVVFAYASIELVGTTAGETKNPQKVIPKAINTVIVRILVFYVGSVLLLSLVRTAGFPARRHRRRHTAGRWTLAGNAHAAACAQRAGARSGTHAGADAQETTGDANLAAFHGATRRLDAMAARGRSAKRQPRARHEVRNLAACLPGSHRRAWRRHWSKGADRKRTGGRNLGGAAGSHTRS